MRLAVFGATGPISRADVADFLLRQSDDDTYLQETPALTSEDGIDAGFLWEQATAVTRRLVSR